MSTPASILEVAARAGVSAATVSRVLNGTKAVNAETRQRVELAVAALGYKANFFGRSLRTSRSGVVLVLVPDFANPFHGEVIAGIESEAREHDRNLLLADAGDLWMRGQVALEASYTRLCDGVISLAAMPSDSDLSRLEPSLPWVACSQFLPDLPVPWVSVDHRRAANDAVQYLINQGHRRIALINSDERFLYAHQRRAGWEDALQRAGLAIEPALLISAGAQGTDFRHGEDAAAKLLALNDPPTAVFAVSDRLAIGAMRTFKRKGRRIPLDIAVIGFDNTPFGEYSEPALTTVAQPARELGAQALRMLGDVLEGRPVQSLTLPHRLILRDSA